MYVVITSINPKVRLVEFIVIFEGRLILASWIPSKYPTKCRIEKVVKGAGLPKDRFVALTEALPIILKEQLAGKTIREWMDLVGSSFAIEAELEAL